jgi:hypothetical protein
MKISNINITVGRVYPKLFKIELFSISSNAIFIGIKQKLKKRTKTTRIFHANNN